MTTEQYIKQLYESRLIRTDKEFETFEKTLEILADIATEDDIPLLCTVFDDNTEEHEVMYGLIHFIEYYRGEKATKLILKNIPAMLLGAKDWAKIFIYRMLNSEPHREIMKNVLGELDETERLMFINVLLEIRNQEPEVFEKKIDEVLGKDDV